MSFSSFRSTDQHDKV